MRKDKDSGVIYTKAEYNQFLKAKIKQKIKVVGEMSVGDFFNLSNIELFNGNFIKIFADEEYSLYIEKLREYLYLKGVVLLVKMGYYGKERAVVLVATPLRILGVFLRDKRLVRGKTQFNQAIADFSVDNSIDKFYEFIELKKADKPIPIVEEVKEKPKLELFFEAELEHLKETAEETKDKLKKKVPIEVKV